MAKRAKNLLVWLHGLTSVGWMSQALALFVLVVYGLKTGDAAGFRMAQVLDHRLLAMLANASAFTGMMLSALTPWGYFRHWWVLAKFVITVVQLYLGIFLLSGNLNAAASTGGTSPAMPVGTALMASAIAFQLWLSVAKPWKRTPWSTAKKLPTGSPTMFLVAVAVPIADCAIGTWLGNPMPALSLLVVIGYSVRRAATARSRSSAGSGRGTPAGPARRAATAPGPR
ncbi:hypothetical protein Lesp02_20080 [Lentzea sp. NBRC 105346]|uniref:hypothetical protein n=1 Tax=Lentzea sp. NBRC 105346 TaxID=3032205 RepID=UPI0024A23B2C|nr:hypothetical protein [Lentzea sp. NBRC 105346]GLZ29818.1 hypothetical protein Lesp02_20080 [Lentzea sp. NBRC 105346]